ncbi:MAG: hypothetical protein AAFQ52_11870 [Chloroflexota bacterium]
MVEHISKIGVWDVVAGETDLPSLTIENLKADSTLKITCQFFGRTMTDDLGDGYIYRIRETGTNLITLTPDVGFVQGSDGWQLFTHVLLMQVPSTAAGNTSTIQVLIGAGDMNGEGAMMNFVLMAETVG